MISAFNIEGVALAYLIGNIIGAIIVIVRIKSPKEFALNLLRKYDGTSAIVIRKEQTTEK